MSATTGSPRRPLSRRQRRVRWTVAFVLTAALGGGGFAYRLYRAERPAAYRPGEEDPDVTRTLARGIPPDAPAPRFVDVTREAGLDGFRSFAGARSSQLPEDMGSGAAWGDFDNDGDEDLFLVSAGGSLDLPPAGKAASELHENHGDGTFRRVADFPDTRILGMGASWGDYNGDGWLDLVVSGFNSLLLFRNDRGRFVRDRSLPEPRGFWTGVAWADFDRDGDLDLYVCGYVRYVESRADRARASQQYGAAVPYTLNPASYQPERNLLFRNTGNGRFVEVAHELKVANPEGRSLSALWHDFDDDGWLDLYVANDISDNVLYRNTGGRFADVSHAAWVADYRGAMGLAAGDWNGDGDDDLFITHWVAQENALYDSLLRDGARSAFRFVDAADSFGLGQIALPFVGWGAEFADLDADGWLDLAVANGSTLETDDTPKRLKPQTPFLFWNRRGEYFHDLAPLSPPLSQPRVARGLAVADYDQDGALDILMVVHGEGVRLLRNDMQKGHWIEIRLRDRVRRGTPTGLGEGARLVAEVGRAALRRSITGASYLSQSTRLAHFGLGSATSVDRLDVRWANGATATFTDLAADRRWEIVEGEASPRLLPPTTSRPVEIGEVTDDRRRVLEFWQAHRAAMHAMKVEHDIPQAIRLFETALERNPSHEDARYYLGNCLAIAGDVDGALAQFAELVRINRQSHRGHARWGTLRAITATSAADLAAAEEALRTAVALNPEETGALLALGEVALLRGDTRAAGERLTLACRSNPRAAGGFFLRAYLAARNGDPPRARALLLEARRARGPDWKPTGTTAEGDVGRRMDSNTTPLADIWESWNGEPDPRTAFARLDARLRSSAGRR